MGHLAGAPEAFETKTGKTKVAFSVATNRRVLGPNGEKVPKADFHRVIAWEQLGKFCKENLTTGDPVYLEGRVHYRSYDGTDGVRRNVTEVMLDEIVFLAKKGNGNGGTHGTTDMTKENSSGAAALASSQSPQKASSRRVKVAV